MLYKLSISTGKEGFYHITDKVKECIRQSGVINGICLIFVPHTTAGVTINENADSDVTRDMIFGLSKSLPDREEYRHMEGNSAAHIKSTLTGCSINIIVDNASLVLGTWQGIYFAEYDGPRQRSYYVKVIEG